MASVGKVRALSSLVARQDFAARTGKSFPTATGYHRDLYTALGYTRSLTLDGYRERYERGDIAERIVEIYPKSTWSGGASIVENPDPGVTTRFEQSVLDIFQRLNVWSTLVRGDILAGLGHYSVIIIGADGDVESEITRSNVFYLKALAENQANIIEYVTDTSDPRFGLPLRYEVSFGSVDSTTQSITKRVHHSRVVHVAEGLLDDDVLGKPRLRSVMNRLDDLDKVIGGGAEAAWRRMDPGMHINLPLDEEVPDSVLDNIQDELEEYQHGLNRNILTRGAELEVLSASVSGFGSNADSILKIISATTGIPFRILLGSERGELASSQDRSNWNDRIASRRSEFAEPLLRSLIDRLVVIGVLPQPSSYEVVWAESEELDEKEKAEVASIIADANNNQKSAEGRVVLTSNEIRDVVFGMEPLEKVADQGSMDDIGVGDIDNGDDGDIDADNVVDRGLRSLFKDTDLTDDEVSDDWSSVHRAADRTSPAIERSITSMWTAVGESIDLDDLELAIISNGVDGGDDYVAGLLPAVPTNDIAASIHSSLSAGGKSASKTANDRGSFRASKGPLVPLANDKLTRLANDKLRMAAFDVSFDSANPRAIAWAEARAADLITEIRPETIAGVRELITNGIRQGLTPQKVAQQVRELVGLRSDQVAAINNLANDIINSEPGTVISRFPPSELRSAPGYRVKVPTTITNDWLEKQVNRYAKMQLNYRARTIARRESIFASNQGQKELWLQAVDNGQLPSTIKRKWISTPDNRTRDDHADMNGQVRGLNEPFESPSGNRIEPGEEVNCRCSQGIA